MTARSKLMGAANDGLVEMYMEYDDETLLVTGLRCINNSDLPAQGWVARDYESPRYESHFPALADVRIDVPATPEEASIPITIGPRNRIYGQQCWFQWPYSGELESAKKAA